MRHKQGKRMLAITLAGTMLFSNGALTALAKQNDDYTDANIKNDGGVGGTVFGDNGTVKHEDGTAVKFNVQTDYDDETFRQPEGLALEETTYAGVYDKGDMESMEGEELAKTVEALLASMTYDEKIHMVSMNSDPEQRDGVGYMTGVPRLGVPETRMHDGPSGVSTSTSDSDSYVETTNFPLQLVASQTWSEDLLSQYGAALGKEQVAIGSGWQLGMQMDLSRTTHWARSKDTFGEDYLLTSKLAVAQTNGIQDAGGIPMAKHIGAYATDGDTSLWVRVGEQALHTAYLYPFESAAKEANLASIMGTYNRLNGFYTSSNYHLQVEILRDMWNWEGSMVPDWGADKEEISMLLGTDISQSSAGSIDKAFRSAVAQGFATMETLDTAVYHALYSLGVCGYLNEVELDEKGYVKQDLSRAVKDSYGQWSSDYDNIKDSRIQFARTIAEDVANGLLEEDNQVALELAEKGIVLLKNENNALPLEEEDYTGENQVAYIGYGATNLIGGTGGERSFGVLEYMTTPLESTKAIVGEDANVEGYILDDIHGVTIPDVYADEEMTTKGWSMTDAIVEGNVTGGGGGFPGGPGGPGGEGGSDAPAPASVEEAETDAEEESTPAENVTTTITDDVHLVTTTNGRSFQNDETGNALEDGAEAEWIGYIEAPASGTYKFVIQTNGGSAKVFIDGLDDEVSASGMAQDGVSWDYYTTEGLNYTAVSANLTAGNKYKLMVSARQTSNYRDQGVKLGWITPTKADEDMAAAIEAASAPNTKVVMFTRTGATGHGPVFQTDYDISLDEIDEIKAVQAAAKEAGNEFILITFGRSGYSFEGDWIDDTDVLICPFYAGQAAGTALAEILTGKVNPSGKLTLTLPKTNNDTLLTYGYYEKDATSGNNYNKNLAGDQSTNSYTARYDEGLNFGYRWYDSEEGAEYQYPFGYGISYTDFEYSNMAVKDNGDFTYTVTVDVKNTGAVEGDDIVQLYIDDNVTVPSNVQVAEKQLVAFARVENIKPGETKTATMTVEKRMLSYWDDSIELTERADGTQDKWIVADGTRTLLAGGSSDALNLKAEITIPEEKADVTGLKTALANVPTDLYQYENADVIESLVKAAEAMKAYAEATAMTEEKQGVINSIAASLKDAIENLTVDPEAKEPADLTVLKEALIKVPSDLSKYTEENVATLTNLVTAAKALAVKEDLTTDDQAMIDSLAAAVVEAVKALEKKGQMGSADADEMIAKAKEAQAAAEAAQAKAEAAQEAAEAAEADAKKAKADAEEAEADAKARAKAAEEAETAAKKAQAEAEIAQAKAEAADAEIALKKAEAAEEAAKAAQTRAEEAEKNADTKAAEAEEAMTQAKKAQSAAELAQAQAETAKKEALEAQTKAEAALESARETQSKAEAALKDALEAQAKAEAAQKAASEAQAKAEAAQKAAAQELENAKAQIQEALTKAQADSQTKAVKTQIVVNKTKFTVKKGKKVTIKAASSDGSKLTFKSSNKKVAKVTAKGRVSGIKRGTATISIKANGVTKKVKVTVK